MKTLRAMSLALLFTGLAVPASAQIVQSVGFGGGFFFPRGFDTRVQGDVLVADLTQPVIPGQGITSSLSFEIKDFRAYPLFGEWNIGIGKHLEVSAGVSYTNKRVRSVYADLVDSKGTATTADDTEIEQDLRLRTVPFTGLVRFFPFGDATSVQPYAGIGFAAVNYRYTETGSFVDLSDFSVFSEQFKTTGTAVGPVFVAGLRMPIGGDVYAFTLEGRVQRASGKVGAGFLGDRIDLGGGSVNFGFLIRY